TLKIDIGTPQSHQLAPPHGTEHSQQHQDPVGGTAAASAKTSASPMTGRSGANSTPAPLIRHGLRTITSSSAAVFKMARSSRYAFATVLAPTPLLTRFLRQDRTRAGVMAQQVQVADERNDLACQQSAVEHTGPFRQIPLSYPPVRVSPQRLWLRYGIQPKA